MSTAHAIDMKELRYVCGVAIVDYAAIIGMDGSNHDGGMFRRIERLLGSAGAMDWLTAPDYSRRQMVDGLKSTPDGTVPQ